MSKCIVNVAYTGGGKTTTVKRNILDKVPNMRKLIYDVNLEYREYYISPLLTIEEFMKRANEARNTCIVFEEATIFFTHQSNSREIRELLVRKRHTKNLLVFNFHSLQQVPLYILNFCNYMYLGNTVDNPNNVANKFKAFPSIYDNYLAIQEEKKQYNFKLIKFF